MLTPEDHIVHAVNLLTCAIQDVKSNNTSSQLAVIKKFKNIFNIWRVTPQQKDIPPKQSTMLQLQQQPQGTPHNSQRSNTLTHQERQAPTVTSKGDQLGTITKGAPQGIITKGALHERQHGQETVAHRTRVKNTKPSQTTTHSIASHTRLQTTALAAHMLAQQATLCLVLNKETGEYMTCTQLRHHPQYAKKNGTDPLPTKWDNFAQG